VKKKGGKKNGQSREQVRALFERGGKKWARKRRPSREFTFSEKGEKGKGMGDGTFNGLGVGN